MKSLLKLSVLMFIFIVVSCNKDDDNNQMIIDEISIETSINQPAISSLINDDEVIEIAFSLDDPSQVFSYLEISWEYDNSSIIESEQDLIFASQFDATVPKSSFDSNLTYGYSILESSLYTKFPSNIFEIEDGLEFKLQWDAYDVNNNLLASNQGNEIVVTVTCLPNEGFMIGQYVLNSEVVWDAVFPRVFLFDQDTIEISTGENLSVRRLPVTFSGIEIDLSVRLDCEGLSVPLELNSEGQAACGEGNSVLFASEGTSEIDYSDDSVVVFQFITDYSQSCDTNYDETFTLVKVE